MSLPASLARAQARRRGELLTRMLSLPAPAELVALNDIASSRERLEWLCLLVKEGAQTLVSRVWEEQRVKKIDEGKSSFAWQAFRQAYGSDHAWPLEDIHVSDRTARLTHEVAGRTLRSLAHRLRIAQALIDHHLPLDEWRELDEKARKAHSVALRAALPRGASPVEIRNLRRRLNRRLRQSGEKASSLSPYALFEPPQLKSVAVPLDAVDKQGAYWLDKETLALALPLTPRPRKRSDWGWAKFSVVVPERRADRFSGWERRKPSLRLTKEGVLSLLLPLEKKRELGAEPTEIRRALGCDWGVRRLLTAALLWLDEEGVVRSDGRALHFDAAGTSRNLEKTRNLGQILNAKIAQIEKLLAGREDPQLRDALERRRTEADRQWRHVRELNEQLACHAARWLLDHALALSCDAIVIEDLASLEGRRLGSLNAALSQQVRGLVFARLAMLCEEHEIKLLVVDPRGTSSYCSRCSSPARHQVRPDQPGGHKNWLVCRCGRSSDRDHSAAERIGARGLAGADASSASTPSVRITRTKRQRVLKPFIPLTPPRRLDRARPRGERPSPRSVLRAPRPGFGHLGLTATPRANRHPSEGRLDGFRHQIHRSRIGAHAPRKRPELLPTQVSAGS